MKLLGGVESRHAGDDTQLAKQAKVGRFGAVNRVACKGQ